MGYQLQAAEMNQLLQSWQGQYRITLRNASGAVAASPTRTASGTGKSGPWTKLCSTRNPTIPYKEVLTLISQTLFFLTEGEKKIALSHKPDDHEEQQIWGGMTMG